ncbi:hypothetical protein NA57DRAFT_43124 [Rhizodiscina lignyota]|uniref:C-CAP/cofactor C-like domain-containing protein n=1 Tax=Rhizodiscina lignyota TaxID=1504668 RepID=A0A9P4IAI8_9PEZI|nr:hypothetical protein NA57DRAFT_43124 [Rhizodiscina lignyota]
MKLRFFRYFQAEVTALQEQMERLANTALAGGERNDAVEHCLAGIARLSQEVKDASSYVPAYDQRTYAEAVKALSEKLQHVRQSFAPRPKFSFKTTRKNASAISLSDAAEITEKERKTNLGYASASDMSPPETSVSNTPIEISSPPNEPAKGTLDKQVQDSIAEIGDRLPSFSQDTSVSISNKRDAHIILPASASHAMTTGTLSQLRRCIVDMSIPTASSPTSSPTASSDHLTAGQKNIEKGKSFAGLTLKSIKDSLLVCGRVDGPAHVTELSNCVVVVACGQFRMHACQKVDVYLECGSRPIIEDCEEVRFAPLSKVKQANGEAFTKQNMWDQVDDFKWLKQEPSPHWSVVPESERVADEIWREKLPGGPQLGINDILMAVGVRRGEENRT